jgi:hypothetical protein
VHGYDHFLGAAEQRKNITNCLHKIGAKVRKNYETYIIIGVRLELALFGKKNDTFNLVKAAPFS